MIKHLFIASIILISTHAIADDLDLLVIYSDEVSGIYGGSAGVEARIDALIDYTDVAFSNSEIDININLLHTAEIAIPGDTETSQSTIEEARDNIDVSRVRRVLQPDLTVYLTTGGDYCGFGYLPLVPADKKYGISIVRHNCTTSFAHEIGHNLGAGHGVIDSSTTHAGFPIATAMGYGEFGIFRTIMAYNDAYQAPRLQYFSNPDVESCAGMACGTSTANSAHGINSNFSSFIKDYSSDWPTPTGYKVAEFGDPAIGNSYNGCEFDNTYSWGGGYTLYKEYTISCNTGQYIMGVIQDNSGFTSCTFDSESSEYYAAGNCSNWRVYLN